MITIKHNVEYTQAKNCWLCVHVGSRAFFFGRREGDGHRIELFTPLHRWRWSRGKRREG